METLGEYAEEESLQTEKENLSRGPIQEYLTTNSLEILQIV